MNKKIAFVTGANGFVGSHLVELLLREGMEVHCLLRKSSDTKWIDGLDITIHREGIENIEYLTQVFSENKPNYIFHIAGTVKAFDYAGFVAGNVRPAKYILEAALGVPSIENIVIASSLAASQPTIVGSPNDESCARSPLTEYGRSKVEEEDVAISYMDRLPISIIRPPVVYGERDVDVLLFFKTIKNHILPLIGFSPKALSLVYVGDLVRGFYQCAISKKSIGQTYFIGGFRDEYTWHEIGKLTSKTMETFTIPLRVPHFLVFVVAYIYQFFSKWSGLPTTFDVQKAREMVSEAWTCTSKKAARDFGYAPQVDISEGFRRTIEWYRSKGWI